MTNGTQIRPRDKIFVLLNVPIYIQVKFTSDRQKKEMSLSITLSRILYIFHLKEWSSNVILNVFCLLFVSGVSRRSKSLYLNQEVFLFLHFSTITFWGS